MKRDEALASLSRDHHQALVVALTLRRADAAGAAQARERFLSFWSGHAHRHFQLEEEILFPRFAAFGDAHHPLVLRALGDHVAIRARAARLAAADPPDLEVLHELGERLATHVRLEERELFGVIEETMPAAALVALAEDLERAETTGTQSGCVRPRSR